MSAGPDTVLRALVAGGVDFVLIGGWAVISRGYVRTTEDVDITYSREPANLTALAEVLLGLRARLRGVAEDVPFSPDARTLKGMEILTLDTDAGALDLLLAPPGAPSYRSVKQAADLFEIAGTEVRVASIPHLISMKESAGRDGDLQDIEALRAIQRLGRG